MNRKDQEQVDLCRRYLLERADRSRSRLVKEQVRRWVDWLDAVQRSERDEGRATREELRRAA